jgi:NAD dependent epimerase/dehydratase family enzyme
VRSSTCSRPASRGRFTLTAPAPASQRDVIAAVARQLRRPSLVRVPRIALKVALGEFADDVLSSQLALPTVLTGDGFHFEQPDLDLAARWITRAAPPRP